MDKDNMVYVGTREGCDLYLGRGTQGIGLYWDTPDSERSKERAAAFHAELNEKLGEFFPLTYAMKEDA